MTRERPGNGGCCRRLVPGRGRGGGAGAGSRRLAVDGTGQRREPVGVTVAGALGTGQPISLQRRQQVNEVRL
jgi:hypothetical protein